MNRLGAEELLLLERTRELVRGAGAGSATGDGRTERTAAQWHTLAARAGLLGLQVPKAMGGLGLSFACKVEALKILASADFGLAMSLVNTHNVAEQIARLGHPDLVARWVPRLLAGECSACTALTEPTAGSDFAAIQTRARAVPGGWQLDGVKTWITNAMHAQVMVVYAQTLEGAGASGIAAFVVDAQAAGFQRQAGPVMGPVASMGTGGFALAACRCSDQDLLAQPGEAFKDILRAINGARVYVAAMCCAMVGECLRVASAYGGQRTAFGKPLYAHQAWRWTLAEAAIELQAAELMVNQAASLVDARADAQSAAAMAKVFATRLAQKHIPALMHAMGAEGLREDGLLVRHLAAAQVAGLVDGSTEMLLERVARDFRAA